MYWSRYAKYGSTRLPKRRQTIPVRGKGEESSKYYHCWHCGAVCNVERELLDYRGRGGNSTEEYIDESTGETLALESLAFNYQTLMLQGPDSGSVSSYYNRKPRTSRGCWFCGCTTWRG